MSKQAAKLVDVLEDDQGMFFVTFILEVDGEEATSFGLHVSAGEPLHTALRTFRREITDQTAELINACLLGGVTHVV